VSPLHQLLLLLLLLLHPMRPTWLNEALGLCIVNHVAANAVLQDSSSSSSA
jgi:hypothetical protein